MARRPNFQTISWFWDLRNRGLLNLDPPFQRRSVWNQAYRESFIDTVLLGYPAPAIFLFEEISQEGSATYDVVDGKQRLTAVFDFADGSFPVGDNAECVQARGRYFTKLDSDEKTHFWSYLFLVEYLQTTDEPVLSSIFNRINKNIAKLTPQELRHAQFDGEFITSAESLTEWMASQLPKDFPRIVAQSRKQMKDVEFTAQLLLLLEEGPKGFSQAELDEAFSKRDESWEGRQDIEDRFRRIIDSIAIVLREPAAAALDTSRLRNQADFYSLFGASARLPQIPESPLPATIAERLAAFITVVEDETARSQNADADLYYQAARSASNDKGPRETRIAIIERVLRGTSR